MWPEKMLQLKAGTFNQRQEDLQQFWEIMVASVYILLYARHCVKHFTYLIAFTP